SLRAAGTDAHRLPPSRPLRTTYLRSPTWMRLDDLQVLVDDTALLARLEGLEAHARAAEVRSGEDRVRPRRPRAGSPPPPHEPRTARPILREPCAAPPRGRRG